MTQAGRVLVSTTGTDPILDDLIEVFAKKLQAGERIDPEAYAREHPERGEELRRILPAMLVLADLAYSAGDPIPSRASRKGEADSALGELGDFRIVREIGRGGMGVVYEAQQISLGRRVALKVLPFAAAMDPKQLQRFKNEAQAAAHLQHQNIVPVHYVGCERGVHFYAMQYIEGQTLAKVIADLRLQVADLQKSAESNEKYPALTATRDYQPAPGLSQSESCNPQSVIGPSTTSPPRDVTPPVAALSTERSTKSSAFFRTVANLAVQAAEALEHAHQTGVIHRDIKPANLLVDAGGRLWVTDFGLARLAGGAGLTMSGDLVGTLRYMSPEQALGQRVAVDARTDIYSLGVTLYELLTLEPAYNGRNREEVLRQIAFEDLRPPSRWNKAVPAELETIVLKAMANNPEERYVTAQELADDLRRYLEDKPIRAKRPSLWQRAVKWARRHKTVVRAAVVVLLLAVAGLAVSTLLIWQANDALERNLYFSRIALAHRELTSNSAYPDRAEEQLELCPPHRRGWEWNYLKRLWRVEPVVLQDPGNKQVYGVAFSPDGEHLAAACGDRTVKVWHIKNRRVVATLHGHEEYVLSVAFSPNGYRLASASADKTVRIWDLGTRQEVLRRPGTQGPEQGLAYSVTFSPDGRWLAAASEEGTVRVWDATSGQQIHKLDGHELTASCVAFSPDGQLLASGDLRGTVRIWDAQTGRLLRELARHKQPVGALAFSPDGARLAAGFFDFDIEVWDTKTLKSLGLLSGHTAMAIGLAFSPDGSRLASASEDQTVRIWDPLTRQEVLKLRGHTGDCQALAFSPDGRLLASASRDRTIRF